MAPTKGSGFAFLLQSAHPSFVHASSISGISASSDGYHSKTQNGDQKCKKHIYLKRY
jgi:hypothetical protein